MPTSPPITIPAYGTTLKKGTVALALVFEIDGPESENAGRNTTHLGSVKKSKRPTLPEGQPLSGKAYTDATNYAVLTADQRPARLPEHLGRGRGEPRIEVNPLAGDVEPVGDKRPFQNLEGLWRNRSGARGRGERLRPARKDDLPFLKEP